MGMRIGGSTSAGAAQAAGAANWQQKQQGVKDLMAALQAGDLGSAQKAYASLTGSGSGSTSAGAPSGNGPLAQIGKALQAGDLAGAQQAAQSWQAARSGHHHHHHQTQAATATPASTGAGSVINLTA